MSLPISSRSIPAVSQCDTVCLSKARIFGSSGAMMEFDIDDLKKKYRKKTRASIMDLSELQVMVPVLVREICRLEQEMAQLNRYVKDLEKKKPPASKAGELGKAQWDVVYDMKVQRLTIWLKGVFDYKSAKQASNAVIEVLAQAEKGFDVINDIRGLTGIADMKTVFHLRKVRYHLVQAGVNRTVRLVSSPNAKMARLFDTYFQSGEKTMVVTAMEDAISALENDGRFLLP